MSKRPFRNRLNDLDPKSWLKFQKSWFLHNPPPRRKDVLRHPAKFPETLAQEFIEFFSKRGQVVLDPMAGTGSALVAALRAGRRSYGIELNPAYADIARTVIEQERAALGEQAATLTAELITGDAVHIAEYVAAHGIPPVDYVITSPPYWDMLRARGASTQKQRRGSPELDVFYSDDHLWQSTHLMLRGAIKFWATLLPPRVLGRRRIFSTLSITFTRTISVSSSIGYRHIFPVMPTDWHISMARTCTSTLIHAREHIKTGVQWSIISSAMKCATSSSPTLCFGLKTTTLTGSGWTQWPP